MDEYIERKAAIEAIMSEPPDAHYPQWYANKIKSIKASNVATVRNGRWIYHLDDLFPEESKQECSYCHEEEYLTLCNENYCPNCGAKMNGGSD